MTIGKSKRTFNNNLTNKTNHKIKKVKNLKIKILKVKIRNSNLNHRNMI